MGKVYDLIVIGGGPGGYTAALYAARAGLSVIVLEKLSAGGQMALTSQVDNYPGFVDGIDGFLLGENMQKQAEQFGAQTELAEVFSVKLDGDLKQIETSEGTFLGRNVIIATGANPKKLGLEDEKQLIGKGVNYCAACDGMFYKGKTVAVVGGGNSAVADALLLSRIAEKVIVIHRRDSLRADKVYHEPLLSAPNVEFIWNSQVDKLLQTEKLSGLQIRNLQTGAISQICVDGVFISIGRVPATALVKEQLSLDPAGYIIADESTKTNLPGVFAVGDVRTKPVRQIVTAVADGAVAAHQAQEHLVNK